MYNNPFRRGQSPREVKKIWVNGQWLHTNLNPLAKEFRPTGIENLSLAHYDSEASHPEVNRNHLQQPELQSNSPRNLEEHRDSGAGLGGKELRVLYTKDGISRISASGPTAVKEKDTPKVEKAKAAKYHPQQMPTQVEAFQKILDTSPRQLSPRSNVKTPDIGTSTKGEYSRPHEADGKCSLHKDAEENKYGSAGDADTKHSVSILPKDGPKVKGTLIRGVLHANDGRAQGSPPIEPTKKTPSNNEELKVEKKWSLRKLTSFVGGGKKPSNKSVDTTAIAKSLTSADLLGASTCVTTSSGMKTLFVSNEKNRKTSPTKLLGLPASPHDIRKSEATTHLVTQEVQGLHKVSASMRSLSKSLPEDGGNGQTAVSLKKPSSPEKFRTKLVDKKSKHSHGAAKP